LSKIRTKVFSCFRLSLENFDGDYKDDFHIVRVRKPEHAILKAK